MENTSTTRGRTLKAALVALVAAAVSAMLFLTPVGISQAQDDDGTQTEEGAQDTTPADPDDDQPLTDEEREALHAEREAEREARRAEVLQALADELGVTVDELTAAMQAVAIDQVDQAVSEGRLTQEQADQIIARIEAGDGFGFGLGGPGQGGRGFGGPGHGGPGHHGRGFGPADPSVS